MLKEMRTLARFWVDRWFADGQDDLVLRLCCTIGEALPTDCLYEFVRGIGPVSHNAVQNVIWDELERRATGR